MRPVLVFALVLLAARDLPAGVDVRVNGDVVDVVAINAPLSDILDVLSRQTHMKVVYEGAPPKQLLSVDLKQRTPAEAVVAVLEGLGLAYAVSLDKTGTQVQTLLMSSAPPVSASNNASQPSPRVVPSPPERPMRESVVEEQPLEDGIPEPDVDTQLPPDTGRPNMMPPQQKGEPAPPPSAGVFLPAPGASSDYPSSAFAPKAPAPSDTKQPQKPDATPPPFNP